MTDLTLLNKMIDNAELNNGICLYKDGDKKCPYKAHEDTKFCKRHAKLGPLKETAEKEGRTLCSAFKTCFTILEPNYDLKTCPTCLETRAKKRKEYLNKNEEKMSGNGVVYNGDGICQMKGCKKSVIDNTNKYCKLHQLQNFVDDTMAKGMKCCTNYNRGCVSQLPIDFKFQRCDNCREAERKRDVQYRNKLKEENQKLTEENKDHKYCTFCNKLRPIDAFRGEREEKETMHCNDCRKIHKDMDTKRDHEHRLELGKKYDSKPERIAKKKEWAEKNHDKVAMRWMNYRQRQIELMGMDAYLKKNADDAKRWRDENPEKTKEINEKRVNSEHYYFATYKRRAEHRNLKFDLSMEEFLNLVSLKCVYCNEFNEGKQFCGIDRLNNQFGYTLQNCVSCCTMCNFLKHCLDEKTFLERVEHILTFNKKINGRLFPNSFVNHMGCYYNDYNKRANKNQIEFSINKEEYSTLINGDCYICGKPTMPPHHFNGIDRYTNTLGYTIENCRSCCGECNIMKNSYDYNTFIMKLMKIYEHQNTKPVSLDETSKELVATETSIPQQQIIMTTTDKKSKDEIREYERKKKQQNREALRKRMGDEEYKKMRAQRLKEERQRAKERKQIQNQVGSNDE